MLINFGHIDPLAVRRHGDAERAACDRKPLDDFSLARVDDGETFAVGARDVSPRTVASHGDARRLAADGKRGDGFHRRQIDDGEIVA